jgi:hypothetical protein
VTFEQTVEKMANEMIIRTGAKAVDLPRLRTICAENLRRKEARANRPLTVKAFAGLGSLK